MMAPASRFRLANESSVATERRDRRGSPEVEQRDRERTLCTRVVAGGGQVVETAVMMPPAQKPITLMSVGAGDVRTSSIARGDAGGVVSRSQSRLLLAEGLRQLSRNGCRPARRVSTKLRPGAGRGSSSGRSEGGTTRTGRWYTVGGRRVLDQLGDVVADDAARASAPGASDLEGARSTIEGNPPLCRRSWSRLGACPAPRSCPSPALRAGRRPDW